MPLNNPTFRAHTRAPKRKFSQTAQNMNDGRFPHAHLSDIPRKTQRFRINGDPVIMATPYEEGRSYLEVEDIEDGATFMAPIKMQKNFVEVPEINLDALASQQKMLIRYIKDIQETDPKKKHLADFQYLLFVSSVLCVVYEKEAEDIQDKYRYIPTEFEKSTKNQKDMYLIITGMMIQMYGINIRAIAEYVCKEYANDFIKRKYNYAKGRNDEFKKCWALGSELIDTHIKQCIQDQLELPVTLNLGDMDWGNINFANIGEQQQPQGANAGAGGGGSLI